MYEAEACDPLGVDSDGTSSPKPPREHGDPPVFARACAPAAPVPPGKPLYAKPSRLEARRCFLSAG